MTSEVFIVKEHAIPAQHIREYRGATVGSQEDELSIHIKEYIPRRSSQPPKDAVTIIGAHANGFPKELYEPLWTDLYERSKGRFSIRSIFIADVAHQGQSYVLNEPKVGNDPSWYDHSRDLLHMVNHFKMPLPIVGIGHSWGGSQLVNLSLMHPRLFAGLILLDPVIELGSTTEANRSPSAGPNKFGIAAASTHRRDLWPSREDAAATFLKSPFYQRWDKRVLDAWLQYGLRDLPTALYKDAGPGKPVTLLTTKHQEVWTYLRPNFGGQNSKGEALFDRNATPDLAPGMLYSYPFYRPESAAIFHKLAFVRPPVLYILGELSNISDPQNRRDKVKMTGVGIGGSGGIAEGRVHDVILEGIGHLVPMEAVDDTARESCNWLEGIMKDWRRNEEAWEKSQEARPPKDNLMVNEAWIQHIGAPPGRAQRSTDPKL